MRRYNLLLISLGVLSFATTLGVLHVTGSRLFRAPLKLAASNMSYVAAAAIAADRIDTDNAAPPVPQTAAATPIPTAGMPAPSTVVEAHTALPEPARAELVTLRAQIENDADVRTRLNAVNSLRKMGLMGDEDGYVRASLRAAMNDANPNVKSNAEMAYEMVAARYGSQ